MRNIYLLIILMFVAGCADKDERPNILFIMSDDHAYQAISAAYLTRVVSSSLADFMAITKGVSEPDLEFIKENSEKIVEKAFEKEKINWQSLISDLKNPLIRLRYSS